MLYMSWVGFPLHLNDLISSKDKEENMVAEEKSPLPQLWCPRDRATFGIPFVIESGIPKILLPFDLDKEAISYMRSCMK